MAAKVLIMAAGTGGHVFPGLACAREFQARGYEVHWLGTQRGIEARLVPEAGFTLHSIAMRGVRGKGVRGLLGAPLNLLRGVFDSLRLLRRLRPVCVLGMGGYVTVPGGLAARLCGVPLVIHEQNAVPGTANRLLARWATRVCEGFAGTFGAGALSTGNPVREALFSLEHALSDRVRLLVLGGSLGAEPLNQLLPEALARLAPELRPEVRHQAGREHADKTQARYDQQGVAAEVQPFIDDMAAAYSWADLVVCRAGALTVSELMAVGVAGLLIPLPHAIDDHQTRNAEVLVQAGAGLRLAQRETNAAQLAEHLQALLAEPQRLQEMGARARTLAKPYATRDVVDCCLGGAHG